MNMHLAQSAEATLELENLCRVSLNIISPENSAPVIGVCQDSLVGAWLLTGDDVRLTRTEFMQLMMRNSSYIFELPKPEGAGGLWTGKQALSTILPDIDVSYGAADEPEKQVLVRGGHITKGQLGKAQLGAKSGSLVHILMNDYSPAETLRFLDNEQNVVNGWLQNSSGFSVGLSDCILPHEGRDSVKAVVREKLAEAYQLLHQGHENVMELVYGKAQADDFELQVAGVLNSTRDATKTEKYFDDTGNRFLAMLYAGSKGNKGNLTQICSCIGQQVVAVRQPDGTHKQQRIPYNHGKIKGGFDGRTLPHFHRHDDSPLARGFVEHSYLEGMTPNEFFFHASSGREGLIDTAIKTAVSVAAFGAAECSCCSVAALFVTILLRAGHGLPAAPAGQADGGLQALLRRHRPKRQPAGVTVRLRRGRAGRHQAGVRRRMRPLVQHERHPPG